MVTEQIIDFMSGIVKKEFPKAKDITLQKVGIRPHKFSVTVEYLAKFKVGRKNYSLKIDSWIDSLNVLMFETESGRYEMPY